MAGGLGIGPFDARSTTAPAGLSSQNLYKRTPAAYKERITVNSPHQHRRRACSLAFDRCRETVMAER